MIRKTLAAAALLLPLATGGAALAADPQTALFAGGCFWCVEADLEKVPGVLGAVSGYAGGKASMPTYKTYEQGGHREVVEVTFDPDRISYGDLVAIFLRTVDPTDAGGQFCDRGFGYSTAIHALDAKQKSAAEKAVADANAALGGRVVTPVEGKARFWAAEDYHQDYAKSQEKQLSRFGIVTRARAYKGYRQACGRDERVRAVWGAEAYRGVPGSS